MPKQVGSSRGPDLLDEAETLIGALRRLVDLRPDAEAVVLLDRSGSEQIVEAEPLWAAASAFGATLLDEGLKPGDVVVLVLPTSRDLISAYFGTLMAGGVPALLSTPSRRVSDPSVFRGRVGHVVSTARPHSLICKSPVAELLREEAGLLGRTRLIDPSTAGSKRGESAAPVPCSPDAIATIQFSSGTTGSPKGVLVSHGAVLNNLRSMRDAFGVVPGDVAVNWIPLFHDMGLFGAFLLPLLCGCKTVIMPTEDFMRSPSLWLRCIDRYRGTFSWAPNMAYTLCASRLSDEEIEGVDLSSWRLALNGSEPVLASTVRAFTDRFEPYGFDPRAMSPAWGLAEVTVLASVHPPTEEPICELIDRTALAREDVARITADDEAVSCVSVGRCIPGVELEVRNEAGEVLADRHVGEIWLRSNALFQCYQGDPQRTSGAVVDGWLRTGDRGYVVAGYVFFVSRLKDVIVIGGEKYLPDDIEAVINRVEGVRQGCVAVFGVADEKRGTEKLAAVVETRASRPDEQEDLRAAIRKAVTRATGLGLGVLVLTPPNGVEKTTSGKLSRSGTRSRYRSELEAGGQP